ncbi:MAG: PHP domain-containing protein [bacterium]|nr:PHP domain-containing protein [bacterium]
MVDFHMHSIFSDGTDNIEELLLKTKDLSYFSITDHDTIEAYEYIIKNGLDKPNYIPGVELSTRDNGDSVHILFYNYDSNCNTLKEVIKEIDDNRKKRLEERINILKDNYDIKFEKEDLDYLYSLNNPTKPNIAKILVKNNYSISVDEAIKVFLYHKLTTKKVESEYVLDKLKNEKGILILAHPLGGIGEVRIDRDKFVDRLNRFINHGLKGLECIYSLYDKEEQDYLLNLAKENNLIISGGSDYHGKNKKVSIGELSKDNNTNYLAINLMEYIKR